MSRPAYTAIPTVLTPTDDFPDIDVHEPVESPNIPLNNLSVTIPVISKTPVAGNELDGSLAQSVVSSHPSSTISGISLDGITQGRLIKLVGIPPPQDESQGTDEEEDSPCLKDVRDLELPIRPPVITMGEDEKGRPIVDVIDSMDEDPFTLDSFERMIRAHALKGKDFLLARVATVDPQDESRFYYSYYSAHQINKVLFRTQPEEGLLHRMKAKNPLNNMIIMGDVHYYVIRAISVNIALLTNRNATTPIVSPKSIGTNPESLFEPATWADDQVLGVIAQRLSTKITRFLQITGINPPPQAATTRKLRIIMRPEGFVGETPEAVSRLQSEEDLFDGQEVSNLETYVQPVDTVLAHIEKFSAFLQTHGDSDIDYCNDFELLRERYQQEIQGTAVSTSQRKVKSSSLANDFGRTREVVTFEEWLKEAAALTSSPTKSESRDEATFGLKSRKSQTPSPDQQCATTKIKIDSPTIDEKSGKLFYIAEYLASDDDYLMKSSVRTIFRENALESDDAVLFTLPTSNNSTDGGVRNGEQHPALRNFIYAIEENGWSVSSRSFKLFLFAYFLLSVAIVKFFVPAEYTYMASFSMLFFLCLFLIIVL
ncbi:hypothetical protein BCR33DRAFT_720804 [Rhizoclosmatium globosum]|uniref:Uncharacterized protein n=1 Tax=Rhizoclosmatium globosum TaxID=329046 RepID=A0A1Y2BUL3_9FUNG|nr:hypothetical protein BCR33DRAFT_720804 [Rhizoclosmatium globosum]|eukprot:ORY38436.1 hypothetical protein BCR33DRAFT_720804 [Rhizoclosmatium globosum]